jgi:DNA-binding NtrC family response regulator
MASATTSTKDDLGWGRGSDEPAPELLHLVIAWSREEPDRIGEAARIEGMRVLGRGGSLPGDIAPRVEFFRQRPGELTLRPPLEGSRISRVQLELSPAPGGTLAVRSVGRTLMLLNGEETTSGLARPGDTLTLRNALVLLVTRRRAAFRALHARPDMLAFRFGEADAHGSVGEGPAAWALRDQLAFAAQARSHVLLQGDSGVGKELAARAIHALSERSGGPFVARNAATLPEGLVDAELFGCAKGYPNAGTPERPGLIADADGGTLFLDEIGEMPQHLQAHLLRVLDSGGQFQRLGETRERRSDLRLVAATNRPLDALKHDFAARLAIRVVIPGLRERREDIPLLLRHLLVRAVRTTPVAVERFFERRERDLAEPRIDPSLIEALLRHRFTHHLRELARLMWVALGTSTDEYLTLTPEVRRDLQLAPAVADATPPEDSTTTSAGEQGVHRAQIEAALGATLGNVTDAARRLGLKNRFALYRLMKRNGIVAPDERQDEE